MDDSTISAMFVIAVILRQYYRDEDIAYAFDLTERKFRHFRIKKLCERLESTTPELC